MNVFTVVSGCCHAEIIVRHGVEHPFPNSPYGIPYKYDACGACGLEIQGYAYVCSCCGVVGCEGVRCA